MDIDDSHQSELVRKRIANVEEQEIFFAKQGLPVSKIWIQSYIPLWKKSVKPVSHSATQRIQRHNTDINHYYVVIMYNKTLQS